MTKPLFFDKVPPHRLPYFVVRVCLIRLTSVISHRTNGSVFEVRSGLTIDFTGMIRRKTRKRLRHIFRLSVTALLINTLIPIVTTHAQTVKAAVQPSPVAVVIAPVAPQDATLPIIPDVPAKKTLVFRSSAYSSTVDQTDGDPFTTASGAKVHPGTIAANGLPFGTRIRIPQYFGNKIFVVEDRMHPRWGNQKLDIWMTTRHEAKQWGVRTIKIEIL